MLSDYLQKRSLSIVLLGNFNPVIIQPFWLAKKNLIREVEAKEVKVEMIHNELVKFNIGGWCEFEITKDRFEFSTSQEPYFLPVKDIATGIFTILKETPIKAFGINHILHYQLTSKEQYYDFGNKLVPLSNWSDFVDEPRVQIVEIVEQKRQDKLPGTYRIRINPNNVEIENGITINVNDHFDLIDSTDVQQFLTLFNNNFENSLNRAWHLADQIWKKIF